MPKIAIVKYLLSNKGGIERRFHNYVDEFLERNYQITVIYCSIEEEYTQNPKVQYLKINVGITPSRKWRKIRFSQKVTKFLSTKDNFDFSLSMGRTGKADVTIAAGNYPMVTSERVSSSTIFKDALLYLDKISFGSSKKIVAASNLVKEDLIKLFGLSEKRIEVLYPPTNKYKFFEHPSDSIKLLQEKYGMNDDHINFLFVSTGHSRKGLGLLLDIFSGLGNKYQLFVIGDPITTKIPNITYLGYSEAPEDFYNASDYLIHPASYEAFGQVVSEALLCGTPVIISEMVGAKEIISQEVGVIINGFDSKVWVEALKKLPKPNSIKLEESLAQLLGINYHIDQLIAILEEVKATAK
ncbi:MAG: glycosyltransferase family 4 protein [bacterium]|nr:glycosyltransferase family 4 protein [bacterium]